MKNGFLLLLYIRYLLSHLDSRHSEAGKESGTAGISAAINYELFKHKPTDWFAQDLFSLDQL